MGPPYEQSNNAYPNFAQLKQKLREMRGAKAMQVHPA